MRNAAGADAWLEAREPGEGVDILLLLVATDGAVAEFGRDVRRLRPNLLIGNVPGLSQVQWPGAVLEIGSLVVRLDSLRGWRRATRWRGRSRDVTPLEGRAPVSELLFIAPARGPRGDDRVARSRL